MAKKAEWEDKIAKMQQERDLILEQTRERKEFFLAIREKTEL